MKNSTKIIKKIQKYAVINLVLIMAFAAVGYAQNNETKKISEAGSGYKLKTDLYAQNSEISIINKNVDILPGLSRGLNKIAKKMVDLLVEEESSSLNAFFTNDNNICSLALTSSYINNQLLGGMKLEFHANPMNGGGALMFKKTF